ncbi:uncharacterized protein [Dysidea avara]|uniref:uncharacterized protein n=1 Tax=Dysidea avara TaxID=196820 RepID=UPI00331E01B4
MMKIHKLEWTDDDVDCSVVPNDEDTQTGMRLVPCSGTSSESSTSTSEEDSSCSKESVMSVFSIYHTYVLQDGDVECSIVPGLLHNTVASNCKPNDEDAQTGMMIDMIKNVYCGAQPRRIDGL